MSLAGNRTLLLLLLDVAYPLLRQIDPWAVQAVPVCRLPFAVCKVLVRLCRASMAVYALFAPAGLQRPDER